MISCYTISVFVSLLSFCDRFGFNDISCETKNVYAVPNQGLFCIFKVPLSRMYALKKMSSNITSYWGSSSIFAYRGLEKGMQIMRFPEAQKLLHIQIGLCPTNKVIFLNIFLPTILSLSTRLILRVTNPMFLVKTLKTAQK